MKLKILCPSCGKFFVIEPIGAMREIERLQTQNMRLMEENNKLRQVMKNDDSIFDHFCTGKPPF